MALCIHIVMQGTDYSKWSSYTKMTNTFHLALNRLLPEPEWTVVNLILKFCPLRALIACNAMNWPGGTTIYFSHKFHHWLMLYTFGQYIVNMQWSITGDGFLTIFKFGICWSMTRVVSESSYVKLTQNAHYEPWSNNKSYEYKCILDFTYFFY